MPRLINASLIYVLMILPHMATTYIVKENGVEVGRWEEDDGGTKIKVIEQKKKIEKEDNDDPNQTLANELTRLLGKQKPTTQRNIANEEEVDTNNSIYKITTVPTLVE